MGRGGEAELAMAKVPLTINRCTTSTHKGQVRDSTREFVPTIGTQSYARRLIVATRPRAPHFHSAVYRRSVPACLRSHFEIGMDHSTVPPVGAL